MKLLLVLATASWCIALAAAVGRGQDEPGHRWIAPRDADARQNPLPGRQDVLAGGKKVFEQRCSVCHAKDGTGTNRGANLTIGQVQGQSDGALFWKISSGNTRTGMPTFSFLPEPQRWQLVMHVRSLAE